MLDLRNLHTYYIEKYGKEKVAEIVGQKSPVIAMWLKTSKFPVDALQSLIEHDPEPIHAIKPLYENPPTGTKLCILMPLMGPPEPKTMDCLLRLYDRREMAFKRIAFNNLSVARNALAAWALRGGFEWFFWLDGDMVVPCGDAPAFKALLDLPDYPDAYAGVNAIYRLLWHYRNGNKEATMVSGAYVSRSKEAIPQYGGGERQEARMLMRLGPRAVIEEKPWSGFGCMLTHRSAFESVIATQGDEIRAAPNNTTAKRWNYEYTFFNPIDDETIGDDVPFARRARKAGHKVLIDFAVQAGHVGDRAYTFADIR